MTHASATSSRLRQLLFAASLCVFAHPALASGALTPDVVGEVTFFVGKAWIAQPGSGEERIRRGTPIRVHDAILTSSNATVHVRFRDNALVSVRQDSRLEIVRYDYDAANPANSIVKLDLKEGVTRAISGKAAKNARENFRLNTPIAAIGVRGTDFVVSASQESVRALVNEGTIVVAPFSAQCSVDAFGPCHDNALELTGAANQIVEVRADALNPVFLPISGRQPVVPETPEPRLYAVAPNAQKDAQEQGTEPYVTSVTTRAVGQKLSEAIAPTPTPPGDSQLGGETSVPAPPLVVTVDATPEIPVAAQTLRQSQLLWGRWYEGDLTNERITVPYGVAAEGRVGAIRNDTYVLFRTQDGTNVVKSGLGVVDFALTQAQATFAPTNGTKSLMSVDGGQLSIDFDRSRFSTSLQLSHAATGDVTFADSGTIYSGGFFHSPKPTYEHGMAGAVSLDGTEAGYVFDANVANGHIEGLTQWSGKP